jgi:hypothetical protein
MEKIFKFNYMAFIVGFTIGILYVYLSTPKPRIITKYPTPYNYDKNIYKNENETCYKYDVDEVKCDTTAIAQPII